MKVKVVDMIAVVVYDCCPKGKITMWRLGVLKLYGNVDPKK